jgi:hypothetical protein
VGQTAGRAKATTQLNAKSFLVGKALFGGNVAGGRVPDEGPPTPSGSDDGSNGSSDGSATASEEEARAGGLAKNVKCGPWERWARQTKEEHSSRQWNGLG